jgi:hypothetical protein
LKDSGKSCILLNNLARPTEQLARLKMQAAAQEKMVATDEEVARQFLAGDTQWPTESNILQTLLSTCQAELRTSGEAQKRQEQASVRLIQEAEADKAKEVASTALLTGNLLLLHRRSV